MDTNLLDLKFARIGARLKIADRPVRRTRMTGLFSLDVQDDHKGEFFEIICQPGADAEIAVLDVQPADRHLLLLVREGKEKSKFLCGHDERHWFVAGIPEKAPVGNVRQAKEALKPGEVQTVQARKGLRAKARSRRKYAAYIRQGEWFFIPDSDLAVDEKLVLANEPLRRGNGGKPHWAEFCYRIEMLLHESRDGLSLADLIHKMAEKGYVSQSKKPRSMVDQAIFRLKKDGRIARIPENLKFVLKDEVA